MTRARHDIRSPLVPVFSGAVLVGAVLVSALFVGASALGVARAGAGGRAADFPGTFAVSSSLLPTELDRTDRRLPVLRATTPQDQPRLVAACLRRAGWEARAFGGGVETTFTVGRNGGDAYRQHSRDFQDCTDSYPVDPIVAHLTPDDGQRLG